MTAAVACAMAKVGHKIPFLDASSATCPATASLPLQSRRAAAKQPEKHLGGLVSIDCDWALVTVCHQFWESIDHSVEGTKCRALRALLTKRHVHFEFVFFSRDVTSKVTPP